MIKIAVKSYRIIIPKLLGILLLSVNFIYAQDSLEVYLIDSYVSFDKPNRLHVSFFTSSPVKSKIDLQSKILTVSDEFTDYHELQYDVTNLSADSSILYYSILLTDSSDSEQRFTGFEAELPEDLIQPGNNYGMLTVCCFGGAIFGLPSPGLVFADGETKLSLSKEIPLFSFYSGGYNYPDYYISVEYTHIPKASAKNLLGANAKYIKQISGIEYISAGTGFVTNFKEFNAASAELSAGLFKIYNVFTVYVRGKFIFDPNDSGRNYRELSVGLYSNFFSLNF